MTAKAVLLKSTEHVVTARTGLPKENNSKEDRLTITTVFDASSSEKIAQLWKDSFAYSLIFPFSFFTLDSSDPASSFGMHLSCNEFQQGR